jgi:hypothetical protein
MGVVLSSQLLECHGRTEKNFAQMMFGHQHQENKYRVQIFGWSQNGTGPVQRALENPGRLECNIVLSSDESYFKKRGRVYPLYGWLTCLPEDIRYKDENIICFGLMPTMAAGDVEYEEGTSASTAKKWHALRKKWNVQQFIAAVIKDLQQHKDGFVMNLGGKPRIVVITVQAFAADYMEKINLCGGKLSSCFQCDQCHIGSSKITDEDEYHRMIGSGSDEDAHLWEEEDTEGHAGNYQRSFSWAPRDNNLSWVPPHRCMQEAGRLVQEAMKVSKGVYGEGGYDAARIHQEGLNGNTNPDFVHVRVRNFKAHKEFVTQNGIAPAPNPLFEVVKGNLFEMMATDELHTLKLGPMEWSIFSTLHMCLASLQSINDDGRPFLKRLMRNVLTIGKHRSTSGHVQVHNQLGNWYTETVPLAKITQEDMDRGARSGFAMASKAPFKFTSTSAESLRDLCMDLPYIVGGVLHGFTLRPNIRDSLEANIQVLLQIVRYHGRIMAPYFSTNDMGTIKTEGIKLLKDMRKVLPEVNRPKAHSLLHVYNCMTQVGSIANVTTAHAERKHIQAKEAALKTNQKNGWEETALTRMQREATMTWAGVGLTDVNAFDNEDSDWDENHEDQGAPSNFKNLNLRKNTNITRPWPVYSALAVHNNSGWTVTMKTYENAVVTGRTKTPLSFSMVGTIGCIEENEAFNKRLIALCPRVLNLGVQVAMHLHTNVVSPVGGAYAAWQPPTSLSKDRHLAVRFLNRHCQPMHVGKEGATCENKADSVLYKTVHVGMSSIAKNALVLRSSVVQGRLFQGHEIATRAIMYVPYKDSHPSIVLERKHLDFVQDKAHFESIRIATLVCTFTVQCIPKPGVFTNGGAAVVQKLNLALVEEYERFSAPNTLPWAGATQLVKLETKHGDTHHREPTTRVIGLDRVLGNVLLLPNLHAQTVPHGTRTGGGIWCDSAENVRDGSTLWLLHDEEWKCRRSHMKAGMDTVAK